MEFTEKEIQILREHFYITRQAYTSIKDYNLSKEAIEMSVKLENKILPEKTEKVKNK